MKNQIDMTRGPILGRLLQFSLPLMASGILQLLFNAADVVVVGRFAGDAAMGAVGSTSVLINLTVNLFQGLSIGANVVAASFYGARQDDMVQKTVHTSVLISFVAGLVLTFAGIFGATGILRLMDSPAEVLPLATRYLKVYFAGIFSTMIYNFGSAILRAKGDTMRPLVILSIAGVLNLGLNLVFVIVFHMSVAGVALATVISQTFSGVAVLVLLAREKEQFHLDLRRLRLHGDVLVRILKIGLPAGVQGIIFSCSNVLIQSSINGFGKDVVAGNAAAQSLEGFVYVAMNSFAQGALTFSSQNTGAGNYRRVRSAVVMAMLSEVVIGTVLGCGIFLLGPWLLRFYTDNPVVVQHGLLRLKYICTVYALCGIMDCMANIIRGMGHSLEPMLITLLFVCGSRVLWIFTVFRMERFHTPQCIFLSYAISWIMTWVVLTVLYSRIYHRQKLAPGQRLR